MREKVVVIGGGVAGLTAAHELAERDFDVQVFERREYLGGKAASTRDANNFPCEHGFRFFPSWYRHLPDTMARIPYRGNQSFRDAKSVADNLVPIDRELLAWYDREPLSLLTHVPRSIHQARIAAQFVSQLAALGLASGEVTFFLQRLLEFAATPDPQRAEKWEHVTWWEYLEADEKSLAYRDLIGATTRLLVAAKAELVSAYTIGRLVMRTLSDALTTIDRILDGPTSEVWIDPWSDHLRGLGATFHLRRELDSIVFAEKTRTPQTTGAPRIGRSSANISHLLFSRVTVSHVERICRLLPQLAAFVDVGGQFYSRPAERVSRREAIEIGRTLKSCHELLGAILRDPEWQAHRAERAQARAGGRAAIDTFDAVDVALRALHVALRREPSGTASNRQPVEPQDVIDCAQLLTALADLRAILPDVDATAPLIFALRDIFETFARAPTPLGAFQFLAPLLATMRASPFAALERVDADYFVFALPVEQMAYYVNRSAAMVTHDPSLARIVPLSDNTAWMSGIQFYLNQPCNIVDGHLVCMDSEWSLTAIEQTQFWRNANLMVSLQPGGPAQAVKAILSVDISTWDTPGRFVQLEAFNCTADEIAFEVWSELKGSLDRVTKTARLRDNMLLGGLPLRAGVNYNLDASLADVYDRKKQAEYEKGRAFEVDSAAASRRELPFIWGAARDFNAEPLLLNRVGTLALRPAARTAIPNMFLAADYVRTETDLACMEGANEAARLAVNALLHAAGSLQPKCTVWPLSVTRDFFANIAGLGDVAQAWGITGRAAGTVGRATQEAFGVASQAVSDLLTRWGDGRRR